jgi:hypothetical protein
MADFFASGRVVDLILILMLAEALVVLAWWRRTGRGLAPAAFLPFLLAGGCLMLALRAALVGAAWPWMALALLGALLAHLLDLRRRWR